MLKNNSRVVVTRVTKNGKVNEFGTILEKTKLNNFRTYTVVLENGSVLQYVRVNRQNNWCAAYIDTNLTKITNYENKI